MAYDPRQDVRLRERRSFDRSPRLGRASVIVLISGWILTFLGLAQNTALLQGYGKGAFWVSLFAAAGLAVASLILRERRRWAIATFILILASPLIAFAVGVLVLAVYAAGLS